MTFLHSVARAFQSTWTGAQRNPVGTIEFILVIGAILILVGWASFSSGLKRDR